jgi:UPF0716 protein FxsA
MLGLLFLFLLAIPIAELYVIVKVAGGIGVLNTLALLVLISIAGAALLKREGMATWRRFNEQMATGRVPAKEATDGAMILFGGALLLTPGFLTDVVGLLFVLPPTRVILKGLFRRAAGGWAVKRMGPSGYAGYRVYDATVTRSRRGDGATSPETPVSSPGRSLPERPESDSPDIG